ncbi:hypothetical protein ACOSQ4_021066 [Xanthoceras sorbifolium]
MVIRDFDGLISVDGSIKLVGHFNPLLAEALAICHGLQMALESGFTSLLVESDALGVINAINSHVVGSSDLGLILSDIFLLASSITASSFSFIPRLANKVADALAKAGLLAVLDLYWVESYPPFLEKLVQNDIPE